MSKGQIIVQDKVIYSYNADVDLWHCNDCGLDYYIDWHNQEKHFLNPPDLGINVSEEIETTEHIG